MVGALEVANGTPGVNIGKIAEFVLYIQMLTFPVSAIGWTASMIQRAAASQKRINEFLKIIPAIKDEEITKTFELSKKIEFVKANFIYDMEQKQITIKKESQLIDLIKVKKEYNPDFDKPLSEIETNYEIVKSN